MCCNRATVAQEECEAEGSSWCNAEGISTMEQELFSIDGAHSVIPGLMGAPNPHMVLEEQDEQW